MEGRCDLIFGKGRVLSARLAGEWGWQGGKPKLKADIYEGLSEGQRATMIFEENELRENPNPIVQAYLLQKMIKASGFAAPSASAMPR